MSGAPDREPPRSARHELRTLAACLLLTGVHVGYRTLVAPGEPEPVRVSTLNAGAVVPGARELAALDRSTCRIVITFSPECPFCKRAAEREKTADRGSAYGASTWITDERGESLAAFTANLPLGATHLLSEPLYRSLEVLAVPGLFLFDGDARLRWVGPYRGDESSTLLHARCTRAEGSYPVEPAG